ncbi:hypothetical protein Nisw_04845 [Candidatus Nitrosopumilus sp. SW]|uniref:Ig-like domain-containing protein n=1 Tax=Candidatus Nitrosopumilus sp. SW TaxID=2508726 RepID=UPI001151E160|nr:Ig-like domain-containing protein [Candidatus Nitrosopumilus sp. SW]QDI88895.1 hypothetical protein Nisw_04845 [Candidatus Nitrosopumilus sp. SW]
MQKVPGIFLYTVLISGGLFSSFAFAQEFPIAEDDFYSVDEDSLLTVEPIGILGNDTNTTNEPLNAILLTDVNFGTLTFHHNGNFTYQPNENSVNTDSFTYVANNGTDNSNEATVIIFVNPINDAPVAQNDHVETQQNVPIRIDVLENDFDVDNDSLNIFLQNDPSEIRGFVEIQESEVLFTPLAGFVGNTTFSYWTSDGEDISNSANVTISVIEVDEESNDSLFEEIFEQIQLIFDKVLALENEITQLKEENALLEERISTLEAFHRTETSGNNEKVTICHKGKNTITISTNALLAHLNHGDTKGNCTNDVSSNSFSTVTSPVTPQITFSNEKVDVCHNGKATLSLPGNAARHHLEHHDDDYLGQCTPNSTSQLEAEKLAKQQADQKQRDAKKAAQEAEKLAKQQADQKQRDAKKAAQEAEKLAKQQADQKQRDAEKAQKEKEKLSKLESKENGPKSK